MSAHVTLVRVRRCAPGTARASPRKRSLRRPPTSTGEARFVPGGEAWGVSLGQLRLAADLCAHAHVRRFAAKCMNAKWVDGAAAAAPAAATPAPAPALAAAN